MTGEFSNGRLWFLALAAAMGGFLFGYDTAVINGGEQQIQAAWRLRQPRRVDLALDARRQGRPGARVHLRVPDHGRQVEHGVDLLVLRHLSHPASSLGDLHLSLNQRKGTPVIKFIVYFGNRGFFPGELIASAIADFKSVLQANGHEALIMEGAGTHYDAVETPEEGAKFAAFRKAYGPGTGIGILGGVPVKTMPLTVGSFKTDNGKLCAFVTEGKATDDPIEKEFFGTDFVFRKDDDDAQGMLNYMSRNGYRHHVAFVRGSWSGAIVEAFSNYLGYEIEKV